MASKGADIPFVDGPAGTDDDLFDWDSAPPELGEGHGLLDSRSQTDAEPEGFIAPLEAPNPVQPWWARSVSFRDIWRSLGLFILIGLGLSKVLYFLVVAHIGLAGAHAGVATNLVVYGVVLLFSGFVMRWTAWGFGLGQVLKPELYADLGVWLLWLGTALAVVGSIAVIALEYIP